MLVCGLFIVGCSAQNLKFWQKNSEPKKVITLDRKKDGSAFQKFWKQFKVNKTVPTPSSYTPTKSEPKTEMKASLAPFPFMNESYAGAAPTLTEKSDIK